MPTVSGIDTDLFTSRLSFTWQETSKRAQIAKAEINNFLIIHYYLKWQITTVAVSGGDQIPIYIFGAADNSLEAQFECFTFWR